MNLRIVASHTIVCLCFAVASNAQIYKDPKAGIDERVEDLLSRMTLEEKIAQMNMNGMGEYRQLPYGAGVVESPFISVQEIARMSAETKRYAREHTRLGIPPIQIGECLHGQLAMGATIFPQAIAQGSTWNPALVERMASAIALEASASGVDQALSPLFDLAREPCYGRTVYLYARQPFGCHHIARSARQARQPCANKLCQGMRHHGQRPFGHCRGG